MTEVGSKRREKAFPTEHVTLGWEIGAFCVFISKDSSESGFFFVTKPLSLRGCFASLSLNPPIRFYRT